MKRKFLVMRQLILLLLPLSFLLTSCGYSEEEWQAQLDKYGKLHQQFDEEQYQHQEAQAQLEQLRTRVNKAKQELQAMGVNLDELHSELQQKGTTNEQLAQNLEELQAALGEYQKRAEQLERIKLRYDELKQKLTLLVNKGLKVEIRHNRMVIRLPGDVLFESAEDQLRSEGKEVLNDVLEVILADEQLRARYFQVAGHTDSDPESDGRYGDNWTLSALRAKQVLLHLVTLETPGTPSDAKTAKANSPSDKQRADSSPALTLAPRPNPSGLPASHLHMAGYADTDPVGPNDTPEGRATNRRVELVLLPNIEEMLDLQELL